MDRNIAMSNDKVSENNTFNFNTSISQQAYTREGQNTWNEGRNNMNDTSCGHLPPMELGGFGGGGGGGCGGDSGAGGGPLAGLPNPMSMLGGGGDSGAGGGSPLAGLPNPMSMLGGGGDGSSSSPLSAMSSILGNQSSDSSSSSSSSSSSTMSEVGEIAGAVAMFI
jgi:hypothetical protein